MLEAVFRLPCSGACVQTHRLRSFFKRGGAFEFKLPHQALTSEFSSNGVPIRWKFVLVFPFFKNKYLIIEIFCISLTSKH